MTDPLTLAAMQKRRDRASSRNLETGSRYGMLSGAVEEEEEEEEESSSSEDEEVDEELLAEVKKEYPYLAITRKIKRKLKKIARAAKVEQEEPANTEVVNKALAPPVPEEELSTLLDTFFEYSWYMNPPSPS